MKIYYSISRVSPKTRYLIGIALWGVGTVAVLPLVVAHIQSYLGQDTSWFFHWLHPMDSEQYFTSGLYAVIWGIALYLLGMVVGDEAMQMHDYDPATYKSATHPFGAVSAIMTVCQTGAILVFLWGLLKIGVAVERLVTN